MKKKTNEKYGADWKIWHYCICNIFRNAWGMELELPSSVRVRWKGQGDKNIFLNPL